MNAAPPVASGVDASLPVVVHNATTKLCDMYGHLLAKAAESHAVEVAQLQHRIRALEGLLAAARTNGLAEVSNDVF